MNNENIILSLPGLILDTILMNLTVTDLLNLRLTCRGFNNYLSISNKTIWQRKFHEMVQRSPFKLSKINDVLNYYHYSDTKSIHFMECCIRLGSIHRELMVDPGREDQLQPHTHVDYRNFKNIVLHIETPMATYWAKRHLQTHHAYLAMGTFSPPNSPSKKIFFCASCVIKTKQDSSKDEDDVTVHPMIPSLNPTFPDPSDEEAYCSYMKVYQDPVQHALQSIRDYLKKYPRLLHQVDAIRFSPAYEPKIHINPLIWTETDIKLRLIKSNFHLISPLEFFNSPRPDVAVISEFLEHVLKSRHSYKQRGCFPSATFFFYEPFCCTTQHRKILTKLLFEKFQVKRVCLVSPLHLLVQTPDPAVLIHASFCNTVVCLHRGGRILGCQHYPSGTATVASYLYSILCRREETKFVSPYCLLNDAVLQCCCLRYSQKYPLGGYTDAYVRDIWPGSPCHKISLGPERYRVPEQVYEEINLPAMVGHLVRNHLTPEEARLALSHVVVTGTFSCLSGFQLRLETDLAKFFPEYSRSICVHLQNQQEIPYDTSLQQQYISFKIMPKIQGTEFWVSQEEYVLLGTAIFDLFPS